MKYISLLLLSFLAVGTAFAQSHRESANYEGATKNGQRGTEDKPFAVKIVPSDEAKAIAKQDKEDRDAKRKSDQDLAKYTGELADYTNDLSRYTKALVVIGIIQALIFICQFIAFGYQGKQLKRTVDTAVMESMPVLSPRVVGGALHPLSSDDQPVIFNASVHLIFENYGKTPAIIRDLRMDLFLNERDEFPAVDFETLTRIAYVPIVGGDSRGVNALMGAAEYTKRITLTRTEFNELLRRPQNPELAVKVRLNAGPSSHQLTATRRGA